MKRQRDYKAEYQRRIASGQRRGLSRSQARGHARSFEMSVKAINRTVGNLSTLYSSGEGLTRGSASFAEAHAQLRGLINSGQSMDQMASIIADALRVDLRYAYSIIYGSP